MTAVHRGPDFADRLTEGERRTLAELRARVEHRPARRPGRWRTPLGVAALVALVSVSSFLLRPHRTDSGPVAASPSPQLASAEAALRALADGTAKVADPPDGNAILHRRLLTVVTSGCQTTAATGESWVTAGSRGKPAAGRLVVALVAPPVAAGCGQPDPRTLFDGPTDDELAEWRRLAGAHGLPHRPATDWVSQALSAATPWRELEPSTHEVDRRIAKLCANFGATDCRALRWTMLVELLASAEASQAQRRAAFESAAAHASEAVLVPGVVADLTGRPGVTLRITQLAESDLAAGAPIAAEVTFDVATGTLLQRTFRTPQGRTETTVFLTVDRTAG